jgi:circadian clock protein KaiC
LNADRVQTGIEGFDALIEGGIPKGYLVLLGGPPGSGKTIFAAQYLHNGAKLGEPGIYVSFAEDRGTFLKAMNRMNIDLEKYEQKGKFKFLDLFPAKEEGVETALDHIFAETSSLKAKRLVIDSFSALSQAFPEKMDTRIVLNIVFGKIARLSGVTTLLISEMPIGSESLGGGMEEFVADGVVVLTQSAKKGHMGRRLNILKMRGTDTCRLQLNYSINQYGFRVFPAPEVKYVGKVFTVKEKTGIQGLDGMLNGGVLKGSATMVAGASGTGKTALALHFIIHGARRNERGVYVSFEEPVEQLVRHGGGFGWNMKELIDNRTITMASYYPEPYNVEELLLKIRTILQEHKPARFVIDSITNLERVLPEHEYTQYIKSAQSYLKAEGVTSLFTAMSEPETFLAGTAISSLVDNIICLRYVEIESSLKKSIVIFKARGTPHDKDIREFEITPKGIAIKEKFRGMEQLLGGARRSRSPRRLQSPKLNL